MRLPPATAAGCRKYARGLRRPEKLFDKKVFSGLFQKTLRTILFFRLDDKMPEKFHFSGTPHRCEAGASQRCGETM
jgi:hypothetical protein